MLRAKSANAANGRSHIGSSQAPTLPFRTQTFAQSTLASLTRAEVRQQPIDAEADALLPINRNDCPPSRAQIARNRQPYALAYPGATPARHHHPVRQPLYPRRRRRESPLPRLRHFSKSGAIRVSLSFIDLPLD
ncbi:hypothetical protein GWK53_03970 [Burkholderia cepacia]|uniref:hypothetical protein n=1 Tax=Burkholderia cepacia TaxID=292 RepID=UPI0013F4B6EB|nr:hypothetical protein [Burkholderia cepacia]NHB05660.1 hypothetical protein [Burkholderia cepacia]